MNHKPRHMLLDHTKNKLIVECTKIPFGALEFPWTMKSAQTAPCGKVMAQKNRA